MPRGRKTSTIAERDAAALERRLKLFRQWIAATREAIAFRDEIDARRRRARRAAESQRACEEQEKDIQHMTQARRRRSRHP